MYTHSEKNSGEESSFSSLRPSLNPCREAGQGSSAGTCWGDARVGVDGMGRLG